MEKKYLITYSDGSYNPLTRTYDPINPVILQDPRISNAIVFDTNRRTIYAQGIEFGNSYTFAYTYQGQGLIGTDLGSGVAYFVTGITQNIDGSISYSYSYSYTTFSNSPALFKHQTLSGASENRNDFYNQYNGYKIVSVENATGANALEPRYGKYVMTGAYLTSNGVLQTAYYDASVASGAAESNTVLTNTVGKKVITGITQSSYGQISYTYTYLNTTHSGSVTGNDFVKTVSLSADGVLSGTTGTFTYQGDGFAGPMFNLQIDHNGKITYSHQSLAATTGRYLYTTYEKGEKLKYGTAPTAYTHVITSIKQDTSGKISYTYVGLYNNPKDYDFHIVSLADEPDSIDENPQTNTVNVIDAMSMINSGENVERHDITYTAVTVPTKVYVDNLIRSNDAMRFCGTVTVSSSSPGNSFTLNHTTNHGPGHDPTPGRADTDTGAVYKVINSGYFGQMRVSPGDIIISYSDTATASSPIGWAAINENIDLRTDTNAAKAWFNGSKSDKVVTNVHLANDGTLSYTYYTLGTTNNAQTTDTTGMVATSESKTNTLTTATTGGVKVLTNATLSHDGLTVKLDATYTYLYTDQNHHSTGARVGSATTGLIQAVNLSSSGQLTYSYINMSVSDPSSSANVTITNSTKQVVITNITQGSNGKISATKKTINTTHSTALYGGTASASTVIGYVNLDVDGNLTYSYVDISNAAYHYQPDIQSDITEPSSSKPIPYNGDDYIDIKFYNDIQKDAKGHITKLTKDWFQLKHQKVPAVQQSTDTGTISVALGSSTTFDVLSSITTTNGHVTGTTKKTFTLSPTHNTISQSANGSTTFATSGTSVLSGLTIDNGHVTKQTYTTVTDENVKFETYTSGKIYIGGTKTAAGSVTTHEFIDGATYVQNKQLYTDVSYAKQSYINGSTYINSIGAYIKGTLATSDDATIGGDAVVKETLSVTGATTLSSTLSVASTSSLTGYVTIGNSIRKKYTNASDVPVIDVASADRDIWMWRVSSTDYSTHYYGFGLKFLGTGEGNYNALALYADNQSGTQIKAAYMLQDGSLTLAKNLRVESGGADIYGDLNAHSNASVNGTLGVLGNATFNNNAQIDGNLTVGGNTTLGNNVNDTTTISGPTTLNSTLSVSGLATISSNSGDAASTANGMNIGTTGHIGAAESTGVGIYSTGKVWIRQSQTLGTGNTNYGLVLDGNNLTFNGSKVWWEGNDGSGSTLDADTLDTHHANEFLMLTGGTMSGLLTLKANQYNDSASGALNMSNSNIYGVNSIIFADKCDNAAEGLQWYRDATHVDSMWVKDGVMYFTPNRPYGGTATTYTIWHSGNVGSGSTLDADTVDGKHANEFLWLTGGTMSGAIRRYYSATSTDPMISLTSNNADAWLWRISHGSSAGVSTSAAHGFGLKYKGSGDGNNNALALFADNQSGTQIEAATMLQDGTVTFAKKVTVSSGGLTVTAGGATITAGGLTVSAGGATITGDVAAKNNLSVTGNASVTGTLGVLGNGTFENNALVKGNFTVNGNTTLGDNAGDTVTTSGPMTVGTTLRVTSGTEYLGSASGDQCHMQYDSVEKCINFLFD